MRLVTAAATFVLDGLGHPHPMKGTSPPAPGRRCRVELITAESEASLLVRHRRLIRFPQLTMPLLAAWTPDHWDVSHTDEIVQRVDFNQRADLVGITANTPAAPHAYALAREFRRRGVAGAIRRAVRRTPARRRVSRRPPATAT